jgi:selenide,water dikinase
LPVPRDDRVLIDFRTHDDAGVYRIDRERALVQTVDFFTPIVDEPYDYGQIAAANALSDVYAMGGRPLTALAIAAFPDGDLDTAIIKAIFKGGFDKLAEAGVSLLGGHTVRDPEIKFGYAVTGMVDPSRIWANTGARPGDLLVLTKPIGTGIVSTALKRGQAPAGLVQAAVASMRSLNREAAGILGRFGDAIHACTDVTGFGLAGHAVEMAEASGVNLVVDPARIPTLDGVLGLALSHLPGGGRTNREHFGPAIDFGSENVAGDATRALIVDPQTSGGLLASVDASVVPEALEALREAGVSAACVGLARAASRPGPSLTLGTLDLSG